MKDSEAPQHNGRDESGRRIEDPQRTPLGYAGTNANWKHLGLRSYKSTTAATMVGGPKEFGGTKAFGPKGCYCNFEDLDKPGNENWGDLNTLLVLPNLLFCPLKFR